MNARSNARRNAFVLAGAMLATAAASHLLRPVADPDREFRLDRLIPPGFGGWREDPTEIPIAPSPDVQAALEQLYDQILSRTYVDDRGQRMMLVVAYGGDQSDSLKAHRQEVCYAAQGFAIRAVRNETLHVDGANLPLVRVHAVKGQRSEPFSYWFTMGDRIAIGRAERLFTQIRYGLAGRIPDGLLVRVSNLSTNLPASYAAQDEFLRSLLRVVEPGTRARLAGAPVRAG